MTVTTHSIPLVSLSEVNAFLEGAPPHPHAGPWPGRTITLSGAWSAGCYAIAVNDLGLAVFSPTADLNSALDRVFLVGRPNASPVIRKLVRSEAPVPGSGTGAPLAARETRRKSFMTPTPLHVPGSRVSPIPGYTHAAFYFKPLDRPAGLEVVPAHEVLWLHPLVSIQSASGS